MQALGKVLRQEYNDEKGFGKLTLRTQTPFNFRYLRFCFFNPTTLPEGLTEYVRVFYIIKNGFTVMTDIQNATPTECDTCGCFCEEQDIIESTRPIGVWSDRLRPRRITFCTACVDFRGERNVKMISQLKLVGSCEKKYTFSIGIRLDFIDGENKQFCSVIFENDPLYPLAKEMEDRGLYYVKGWCCV